MSDQELIARAREYQQYAARLGFRVDFKVCLKHILCEEKDEITEEDVAQIERIQNAL